MMGILFLLSEAQKRDFRQKTDLSFIYREVKKRLVNLVKQDPGSVRQNS